MIDVLKKPHCISIGEKSHTVHDLQQELQRRGVRCSVDGEMLLGEIAKTSPLSRQYILECKTAQDFGYNNQKSRPKLQALINRASEEGLNLCPHEVPVRLMLRRPCPVKGGRALLVVTPGVIIEGRPFLPMIQGIVETGGGVTGRIRMVTGDPFVEWSLDTVMVFCRLLK
jgi:hypothetical protein